MTCMNDYIQLTNISKTFGKQTVLQPLTMGFEEGMIHGIIGRNGSGKNRFDENDSGYFAADNGNGHSGR